MFKKAKEGYFKFEEFEAAHGFSCREFGDCRKEKNADNFLKTLGLKKEDLVLAQQVHSNKIKIVSWRDKGKIIAGVDGLLTNNWYLPLGVRSADCLPILFFEPQMKIIGAAHAGWRGVLARLPQKMVDLIIRMGGVPEDILVAIGPHICKKCYLVEKNRTKQFIAEFGKLEGMVKIGIKKDWLDLEIPTTNQLFHSGMKLSHIFTSKTCTSCKNKEFFSFRQDNKETYGEMLSVISL